MPTSIEFPLGQKQRGITAQLGLLPLRIGSIELSVRCLFVDAPGAPFLLGRADFLERFVVTIDTESSKIILREIPPRSET